LGKEKKLQETIIFCSELRIEKMKSQWEDKEEKNQPVNLYFRDG
jgi:hypothetical protein